MFLVLLLHFCFILTSPFAFAYELLPFACTQLLSYFYFTCFYICNFTCFTCFTCFWPLACEKQMWKANVKSNCEKQMFTFLLASVAFFLFLFDLLASVAFCVFFFTSWPLLHLFLFLFFCLWLLPLTFAFDCKSKGCKSKGCKSKGD